MVQTAEVNNTIGSQFSPKICLFPLNRSCNDNSCFDEMSFSTNYHDNIHNTCVNPQVRERTRPAVPGYPHGLEEKAAMFTNWRKKFQHQKL